MQKLKKIKIKIKNKYDDINNEKAMKWTYKSRITRKTSVGNFTSKYSRGNM